MYRSDFYYAQFFSDFIGDIFISYKVWKEFSSEYEKYNCSLSLNFYNMLAVSLNSFAFEVTASFLSMQLDIVYVLELQLYSINTIFITKIIVSTTRVPSN